MNLSAPLIHALDVGCGTGLSTVALTEIATHVLGMDISAEMMTLAPRDARLTYVVAPAEQMPPRAEAFDVLTVSSAFHWLQCDAFLGEARRVLRSQGWLVIYDNYFSAHMLDDATFHAWFREYYLQRYPLPPRNREPFGAADAERAGYRFAAQDSYETTVRFRHDGLIAYLVTQSNIIAAVEGGRESLTEVEAWLATQLEPFFTPHGEGTFRFRGFIWYLAKM